MPNYSTVLASSYDLYAITPVNQPIRTAFPKIPITLNTSKNNTSKTCFILNPIESQFLILSNLLKAISLQGFTGFLSIKKRIYNIILIFCVIKNLLLSTSYLTKLIPPRLFTIVFTWSILFPKKNEDLPLILPEQCLLPPSPTPTMIISLLGKDLCFTRMKTCLIPGLLTLIKISLVICLFGLTDCGPTLALLVTYF